MASGIDPELADALLGLLGDADAEVRLAVLEVLGNSPTYAGRNEALITGLEDPDPRMRRVAVAAISEESWTIRAQAQSQEECGMHVRERYQVRPERRLAIGGVYRVVDTVRRETVMLKVLVGLRHPNVERVREGFAAEEGWCLVMECIHETSLGEMMQAGRIPLPRLRAIMIQTLRALAYLHRRGIVHRTIGPQAIVVGPNDHVTITNLDGVQMAGPTDITHPIVGNPRYMAPGQIEGKVLDRRADLYSLGAVLHEALTGGHPFEAQDPMRVAYGHVHVQPRPPHRVTPTVPEDWSDLVLLALAKDPAERFAGAEGMERALISLGSF